MADNGVVVGGRLTDWVSLGVLAAFVPRDAVDEAIAATGKQAKRSDGKLPPHVMVYLVMALALFADDDYEEVAARLTETLSSWGCWDEAWSVPASGGITQARQRLGYEPVKELFGEVAVPVAELLTRGALLGGWRLMAIGGLEWDAPDTEENAAAFGYSGKSSGDADRPAFPKVRVVTVSECASHAVVDAAIGGVAGKGAGEQSLARKLYQRLEEDWLLIADRNFFNWAGWCTAADSGAALLWRVKSDLTLPLLELLPDGSYRSVLISPKIGGKARKALIEAARAGEDLDEGKARYVRVVEYEIPDREGDGKGEVIALVTTITEMTAAPAAARGGVSPKMGARDRECPAQDLPARPRAGAAVQEPGHGPPGTLRLPAHPLRDQRTDLPGRHRGRHRPRPHQIQAHHPDRPPPGRRPGGLSPLSSSASSRQSWPASPAAGTSTPGAAIGPTPEWSSEPVTTPTG